MGNYLKARMRDGHFPDIVTGAGCLPSIITFNHHQCAIWRPALNNHQEALVAPSTQYQCTPQLPCPSSSWSLLPPGGRSAASALCKGCLPWSRALEPPPPQRQSRPMSAGYQGPESPSVSTGSDPPGCSRSRLSGPQGHRSHRGTTAHGAARAAQRARCPGSAHTRSTCQTAARAPTSPRARSPACTCRPQQRHQNFSEAAHAQRAARVIRANRARMSFTAAPLPLHSFLLGTRGPQGRNCKVSPCSSPLELIRQHPHGCTRSAACLLCSGCQSKRHQLHPALHARKG